MNPIVITKYALQFAVTSGVGTVVGNAVKNSTPEDVSRLTKISIRIGSIALASYAGALVAKHVEDEVDKAIESFRSMKNPPSN